ncbi:hypothetical protein D1871_08790 [Nakamurella silvestris]|nr:hypothetical protein D1871_08790 [Nakamurella silvestris]
MADQDISDNDLSVSFVDGAGDCSLPPIVPVPLPGATFTVCVTVSVVLPGIPGILSGEKNTVTGAYVIHLDELRENG